MTQGSFFGHPNIARCRGGSTLECAFVSLEKDAAPNFNPPDSLLPSGLGGLMEYSSYAFGGAYYGNLFIGRYKRATFRYTVETQTFIDDLHDADYPSSPGIDVAHAPAGVHIIASFADGRVLINYPVDQTVAKSGNPSVYDILPTKASKSQPTPNTFTVGGANFDKIKGARSPSYTLSQWPATRSQGMTQGLHCISGAACGEHTSAQCCAGHAVPGSPKGRMQVLILSAYLHVP